LDLATIVQSINDSGMSDWLRSSLKAMPTVEAIHVLTAAVVFGSILIVDLRLLGLTALRRPVTQVSHELIRATWGAFAVSAVTGAMLFAVNAVTYYNNTAFKLKLLALLAAGVNMAVYELVTSRNVSSWNRDVMPPGTARLAGALSILIWTTVIFLGRWIGFTKGYDFAIPDEVEFSFE